MREPDLFSMEYERDDLRVKVTAPMSDLVLNMAQKLLQAGANLAADHADRVHNGEWTTEAMAFLLQYARSHDRFQCSDVRDAAVGKVLPAPDPRAWGAVVIAAHRHKLIRPLGYAPTMRRKSHGRQEQRWTLVHLHRA